LDELYPEVFRAYWVQGRDIGDRDVLLELAEGAGMNRRIAGEALADNRFAALVEASTQAALSIGIDGLPAWILDGRSLITGVESEAVFTQALADLGHDVSATRSVTR
jgi:protein disulfide-isomerase